VLVSLTPERLGPMMHLDTEFVTRPPAATNVGWVSDPTRVRTESQPTKMRGARMLRLKSPLFFFWRAFWRQRR
jgi:hypothetical protein